MYLDFGFERLKLPNNIERNGFSLLKNGEPFALLVPGLVIRNVNRQLVFHGPNGEARSISTSNTDCWAALVASGGLLFGSPSSIELVNSLLGDHILSRTVSWLCSLLPDCDAVDTAVFQIRNSNIILFGCGGIGGLSAMILAGSGVTNIILIDPDIIESSNLNRQILFSINDVGQYKVDIISSRIKDSFPFVKVSTYKEKIDSSDRFRDILIEKEVISAVLMTADDPIGMGGVVSQECAKQNVFFCGAGYIHGKTVITTGSFSSEENSQSYRMTDGIMPSAPVPNVHAAAISCDEILRNIVVNHNKIDRTPISHSWDFSNDWQFSNTDN